MDDKIKKRNSLNINGTSGIIHSKEFPPDKFHIRGDQIEHSQTKCIKKEEKVEDIVINNEKSVPNSTSEDKSKMVQDENAINDGADEQMLGGDDNGKLTEKREEVKFIKGDHQNGDAKIDIGTVNGKSFTGMTKEELMKYANDPFWVRLRWIFFIGFWAIWIAMFVGAILIIVKAPKCLAPTPLPWYKRGPLARFQSVDSFNENDVDATKRVQATGVIYELPPELTYSVSNPEVKEKIENIVAKYQKSDVNVILDITPNYVDKNSEMLKNALADDTKRSPFVWIQQHEVPNNWVSIKNGTAWTEIQSGNFILSQFGDGLYDLHMNDTIVKKEFEATLCHLIGLGVRGIRLKNTKFYLVSKKIESEVPASNPGFSHTDYGFWTHTQTTFQEGLGDILEEYSNIVKNCSADAYVSVAEDLLRPEAYQTKNGTLGIELPIYGRFVHYVGTNDGTKMQTEIANSFRAVGNHTWLQWDLTDLLTSDQEGKDPSALILYMAMLPGVPVIPMEVEMFKNVSDATFKHVAQLRHSPSYMHGDFQLYVSSELAAYSRIKSGNPGYFVVYNPTDMLQPGNFTNMGLPDKMTVDSLSDNYNVTNIAVKSKLTIDNLKVSPYSTIILTYVPLKSD